MIVVHIYISYYFIQVVGIIGVSVSGWVFFVGVVSVVNNIQIG